MEHSGKRLADRARRSAGLLRILTPREFRTRYRQSVLDIAWSLISPVVVCAVYGVILTSSFEVEGTCAPYLSSAWTGLVLWTFFATAVGTATGSLLGSADLLSKVYFPREVIPLAVVGATLVDLGIGVGTLVVVVVVQGVGLGATSLLALPAIVLLVVWSAALSMVFGVVAVFLRDVNHAVQLGLRVGFFATPVMYEASFLPASFHWTATASPVAVAIEGVREPLLCGQVPAWGPIATHLVLGLALVVGAVIYTRAVEDRMVDVI